MVWLDAAGNTPSAPNENLGPRADGAVHARGSATTGERRRQAARALTGWRVDRSAAAPAARSMPARHDPGNEDDPRRDRDFDADGLVDLLVAQPASPRYLATRLWGWLVAPTPPRRPRLDRLVAAYGPGRDTTALFAAMLSDPAFVDPASVAGQAAGRVRWSGRSGRCGIRPSQLPDKGKRALLAGLTRLGQVPFRPPSVGGWPAGGGLADHRGAEARCDCRRLAAATADGAGAG